MDRFSIQHRDRPASSVICETGAELIVDEGVQQNAGVFAIHVAYS